MYYDLIAKLDLEPLFRGYWSKIREESIHIGLGRPRRRACRFVDYIIPIIPYYPLWSSHVVHIIPIIPYYPFVFQIFPYFVYYNR